MSIAVMTLLWVAGISIGLFIVAISNSIIVESKSIEEKLNKLKEKNGKKSITNNSSRLS